MKRRSMFPWALSGGLALALFALLDHRREVPEVRTAPVLQRLQALGELHTARFEYSDVVNHRTYQKPSGFWAEVPGVDAVARATTENSALIDVRGSVEAGVDLRKLQAVRTPLGLRLTLPAPHAYRPEVDADLYASKRGILWKDDAIALEAVAQARERLAQAALQQGLLTNARREAETRVRTLVESLGGKVAEIRFDEV